MPIIAEVSPGDLASRECQSRGRSPADPTARSAISLAERCIFYARRSGYPLSRLYRLSEHPDWERLGEFVADDAVHNGRVLGVDGYRAMLDQNYRDIPDLYFDAELVVAKEAQSDCPYLAAM